MQKFKIVFIGRDDYKDEGIAFWQPVTIKEWSAEKLNFKKAIKDFLSEDKGENFSIHKLDEENQKFSLKTSANFDGKRYRYNEYYVIETA